MPQPWRTGRRAGPTFPLPVPRLDLLAGRGAQGRAGLCGVSAISIRASSGLVPVSLGTWEGFVFARLSAEGPDLREFLGDLVTRFEPLHLDRLHFFERRHYLFDCNWKVFVDNYLDGGYHVPHLHKGLDSVLDYANYTIENGERYCLQSSPVVSAGAEAETGAVRQGASALYYWIYPNFMINWYEGLMDTNFVRPLGVDRTEVIFDFYFRGRLRSGAGPKPRQRRGGPAHPGRRHRDLPFRADADSPRAPTSPAGSRCAGGRRAPLPSPARRRSEERPDGGVELHRKRGTTWPVPADRS